MTGTEMLEKIKKDPDLREFFLNFCDFNPYAKPQKTFDLDGEMKFNIGGLAFGCSGDGSDFLLLDDGTVGLNGSEGDIGRIAENMEDFFALLLNFPCFWDYLNKEIYLEENKEKFRNKFEDQMAEMTEGDEYAKIRSKVSKKLNIPIDEDVVNNTAKKFYNAAARAPRFGYFFEGEYYDELFTHICYWV